MLLVDTDEDDKKVEEDDGNNDDIYIFSLYLHSLLHVLFTIFIPYLHFQTFQRDRLLFIPPFSVCVEQGSQPGGTRPPGSHGVLSGEPYRNTKILASSLVEFCDTYSTYI